MLLYSANPSDGMGAVRRDQQRQIRRKVRDIATNSEPLCHFSPNKLVDGTLVGFGDCSLCIFAWITIILRSIKAIGLKRPKMFGHL